MRPNNKNSLIKASFFILFATLVFNALNFLYHFFAAKMLGPSEYGIVASLFSVIYLLGIGSTTIQNTVTKFTAGFKSKKEYGKVYSLFNRAMKKFILLSLVISLIWLLISPLIADFLKISVLNVLILIPMIVLSIVTPLNRGVMQGLQKFGSLGWNMIIEGSVKFVLALAAIYVGLKSNGVISAASVGMFVAFLLTFKYLKFDVKKDHFDSKEIYKFSFITLAALTLIAALYSLDVFLVKHFFDSVTAGYYALLSLFGKVVFFGATSVGLVMFPKITEVHRTNKKESSKIFRQSMMFTLLISSVITVFYFIFSEKIIGLLFGNAYIDVAPLLGWFGVFMIFLSMIYMITLYKLAIGKKRFISFIGIAVVAEIILISIFHSSLTQILTSLVSLSLLLFLTLLLKK